MSEPYLDQAILRRLLDYDPESGLFTWKTRENARKAWNTRYAGKRAGYPWSPPPGNVTYWVIRIFDWPFLGHRLAFLYMTGRWPHPSADHADLDGLNNRWANLREATKQQNAANTRGMTRSATGFKGVTRSAGRFRATIGIKGRQKWLGYFDTAEEAHAAYCAAAREAFGEFARTK